MWRKDFEVGHIAPRSDFTLALASRGDSANSVEPSAVGMKSGRQPTLMGYLNVTECINAQSIEQETKFPNKNVLANGNEILAGDTVTLLGTTASQLRVRLPASAAIDLKAPPAKDDRFHYSSAERSAVQRRSRELLVDNTPTPGALLSL